MTEGPIRRRACVVALLCLGLQAVTAAELPDPEGEILLTIRGADGVVVELDRAMLEALPVSELRTSTSVTDGVHHFEGVLMRDLLNHMAVAGQTVIATALNDYVITLEREEFDRYDVLAAWAMDGERLRPSDKGPLWIVYPRDSHAELQDIRYDYRWVWQLVRLDLE